MKILFIQGGFGAGGAEKVMADVAAHRLAQGDEVDVAAMVMPKEGSFFDYPAGVRLHVLDAPNRKPGGRLLQPRRAFAIRRLIKKVQPDIIVSFLTKVNCLTLLAATGTGIPVVISERNNPAVQSARFWRRLQIALMPRAAGIAMQTEGAASDLPPAQQARSHIIPNPCLPVAYTPAPPSDTCRFVAVGRLDHQKGFDMLLDAFARLPRELPANLTIFGEGKARPRLEKQIRDLKLEGRARLGGLVPTAADWLSKGDAVVVSSRYEGFCNVVAEATCSGFPTISFDCPFGPSEMVRDGKNGLLVANGDIVGLGAAMTWVASDRALRERLGKSAHIVADKLDPAHIMSQWDTIIAEAMTVPQTAESFASS
ncbi:glycosyltransferase [Paracoccus aurantiacus]|nr:glycosyltransferase [Paracoccus aurantiacus]